jgi:hypothetical protein
LKPLSLLKSSLFSLMWMASFTIQSMYPDVLYRMVMLLKSIWCPVFTQCSATADFSGWSRRMCLICPLHLVSMDLPVCPMYTFPHSYGIWYTPGMMKITNRSSGYVWQLWDMQLSVAVHRSHNFITMNL